MKNTVGIFFGGGLCWVFVAAHRLSLVGGERGLLFIVVCRLIAVASLAVEHGL